MLVFELLEEVSLGMSAFTIFVYLWQYFGINAGWALRPEILFY